MRSEVERQAVRERWTQRRLLGLFNIGSGDPGQWAKQIGGVIFVAIDNSTCMVTPEQHEFYVAVVRGQREEERGCGSPVPVILLVHVPLFTTATYQACPGQAFYCGDTVNTGAANTQAPDAETLAFVARVRADSVAGASALVAVLAGHIHSAQAQPLAPGTDAGATDGAAGAVQYVAGAGCEEDYRELMLLPLQPEGRL